GLGRVWGAGVLHHEAWLGPLTLGDVLPHTKHAAGPTRLVPPDIALTVDDPHLASGPDHAVLDIVAPTTPQRLRHSLDHALLIFGVDQGRQLREAEELRVRLQSKDAIGFVRPGEAIRFGVVLPVADVREGLGLFEFALAVTHRAQHHDAGQGVF